MMLVIISIGRGHHHREEEPKGQGQIELVVLDELCFDGNKSNGKFSLE